MMFDTSLGFLDASLFWNGQRAASLGVPYSTVYPHVHHDDRVDGVHVEFTLWLDCVSHWHRDRSRTRFYCIFPGETVLVCTG